MKRLYSSRRIWKKMEPNTGFRENVRKQAPRYGPQGNCKKIEQNMYILKKRSDSMENLETDLRIPQNVRDQTERVDSNHTGNVGAQIDHKRTHTILA